MNRIASRVVRTPNSNDMTDDHAIQINMRNLHHEIYSNERFNDVSVLIIDYYMDEMTGIEVCETLKNHIENYINIAKDQDGETHLIEALIKRKMVPFFFSEDDFQKPVSARENFLHQAYPFPGINGYYYTIVEGHIRNNLNTGKMVTYS